MNTLTIVLLVILVVLVGVLIAFIFWKKAQKKQEEQQAQIEAAKQTVSMLVIDKKTTSHKRIWSPADGDRSDTEDDASYQTAYC